MTAPLLYDSLAAYWPVFSPPDEYVEEVETFRRRFIRHGVADGASVLHLGSGGGSIDFHLKRWYRVVGVDISPGMIEQARRLNPEVEYVQGDIRDVRLDRTFDVVLVHDAIAYMTSVGELEAAYDTAARHLSPGGLLVTIPEELKERVPALQPSVEARRVGGTELHMTTHHDPDPDDDWFENVYVFLIREGDDLRVEVDRHRVGAFELHDFLGAIRKAGLAPSVERWELPTWGDEPELPLITAVKA